ncbi:MAG: hypothetical protein ACREME_12320 [Gemmatimonadales bacterium]
MSDGPDVFGGRWPRLAGLDPGQAAWNSAEVVESTSGSMVTLTCGCGIDHPGQPEGQRGCGCYALAVVDAGSG